MKKQTFYCTIGSVLAVLIMVVFAVARFLAGIVITLVLAVFFLAFFSNCAHGADLDDLCEIPQGECPLWVHLETLGTAHFGMRATYWHTVPADFVSVLTPGELQGDDIFVGSWVLLSPAWEGHPKMVEWFFRMDDDPWAMIGRCTCDVDTKNVLHESWAPGSIDPPAATEGQENDEHDS